MADGGFLVKFDGQDADRCYAVSFDYDEWYYTVNNKRKKDLPPKLETITIEIELP